MYDMTLSVKRGAAFLDEYYPGWALDVNRDELKMSSCHECVLGQVYGSYWEALRKFTKQATEWGSWEWEHDHGFNLPNEVFNCDCDTVDEEPSCEHRLPWDALRDKWIDQIIERLV